MRRARVVAALRFGVRAVARTRIPPLMRRRMSSVSRTASAPAATRASYIRSGTS